MSILQVNDLQKVYTTRFGGVRVPALTGVTFSVEPSEYVAIMGESGAGKTTLLNLLAALDKPTAGQILLDGKDLSAVPEARLAAFRRKNLGFVFQNREICFFVHCFSFPLPMCRNGYEVGCAGTRFSVVQSLISSVNVDAKTDKRCAFNCVCGCFVYSPRVVEESVFINRPNLLKHRH